MFPPQMESMMIKKSKNPLVEVYIGTNYSTVASLDRIWKYYPSAWDYTMNTVGNYRWQDPLGDVGDSWSKVGTEVQRFLSAKYQYHPYLNNANPSLARYSYQGAHRVNVDPPLPAADPYDPAGWGATAYARMKPAQPDFNSLNFIYEMRDLPSMLKQQFDFSAKTLGKLFLSGQFGWAPLLRDTQTLVSTQMRAQQLLSQLIRDNGQPVRRRIKLLDESSFSTPVLESGGGYIWPSPMATVGTTRQSTWTRTSTKVWASARFRYWLPEGPRDIRWTASMYARIFGFRLTPEVVYNAVPWTWMYDWFSNAGDAISNMSSDIADRVAADYNYLMAERRISNIREAVVTVPTDNGAKAMTPTTISSYVQKQRMKGNPFGFGTTSTNLSSMQLAILGALGLSRL
jgi:hypothetical protein